MQPKKYNQSIIDKALPYLELGMSWRSIAETIGISKSTLSDNLRVWAKADENVTENTPRILVLDLETSPAVAAAFGRFKVNLSQDHIISEGGVILCAGYKWLGQEVTHLLHIHNQSLTELNDLNVVTELWELLYEADAIICHNAKGFDFPMLQARVLYHGLPPLPNVKIIDTLLMAKKNFRLPNNKLDSIASFLGLERKGGAGGILTWINYMNGDTEAVEQMHKYCLQDVNVLEQVYYRLRSFGHTGSDYNASHYYDDVSMRCHVCGKDDVSPTGRKVFTPVSMFNEMRCGDCGAISRTRTPLNTKEKRSNIVVPPKQ